MTSLPKKPGAQFVVGRLGALLATADARRPLAVLMLDLDRFKHVNDGLGHGFSDRMLCGWRAGSSRLGAGLQRAAGAAGWRRVRADAAAAVMRRAPAGVARAVLATLQQPLRIDRADGRLLSRTGHRAGARAAPDETLLAQVEVAMYGPSAG